MKIVRNVLSIFAGIVGFLICEFLLTRVLNFLLRIPILSLLMTGYIPVDIFFSTTVAWATIIITFYIVKSISKYTSINYSVIIVFALLLITYIITLIYNISTNGFDFRKLVPTAIYIGFLIFGCSMAKEEI